MCTHPRGCFLYEEHCSLTSHRWTSNLPVSCMWGLPGGSVVKNLPANAAGKGSIPGSGSSPREGNGNPCQYSCLGNPMDRGAQQATIHGVTESDMTEQLNDPCTCKVAWKTKHSTISLSLSFTPSLLLSLSLSFPFFHLLAGSPQANYFRLLSASVSLSIKWE